MLVYMGVYWCILSVGYDWCCLFIGIYEFVSRICDCDCDLDSVDTSTHVYIYTYILHAPCNLDRCV